MSIILDCQVSEFFIIFFVICRVRLKEAEEEEFHRVDMEKRIKNLLSLKNNIESNKV